MRRRNGYTESRSGVGWRREQQQQQQQQSGSGSAAAGAAGVVSGTTIYHTRRPGPADSLTATATSTSGAFNHPGTIHRGGVGGGGGITGKKRDWAVVSASASASASSSASPSASCSPSASPGPPGGARRPVEKRQKVDRDRGQTAIAQPPPAPPAQTIAGRGLIPRIQKLLVEATTQDTELQGWKARCRELEKTVRDQRTILDTYRDDDDEGGGGASDENYGRVAGQLERKNAKLERQGELVSRLSGDKAALKKVVTELKSDVAKLSKKVEQGGEREDALEVKIEGMKKEGRDISAEKKDVSKELTARKREVESLKKKLQTSEKKVKKIEENLAATQVESDEWKEKFHKAFKAGKTEVTANKKMIAELTKKVQQREKEVAAEGKTIEKLENNLEFMNKRLQKAKDKRTPCELCTNQMWAAALHLTLQACEDREDDDRDVSLSVLHRTIKDLAKKFPEIERNREVGRAFITKVPHYFEQEPAPDESSGNHAPASGEAALSGGLCAMCSNEEVIQALYWVIEACQYPEQSSWWHPELTKHMYAWHSAYSGLIERCLAGCNAVRPIDMSDDEDENEQQNDGDEEPHPPPEKTMEEKIREKYYHYYVLLVRVQQTVQVFEDAGMPLAELGGAYKNLKAELDRRKENGTSLSAMQDRLDLGQAYLEEQVAYWAKDRSVVSGDTIDYTPLAVGLPEKLQALREELEEKNREVSGILARASDAQADAKEGIPYAQFKSEMETFADPLRERYGAPEMLPGIPVKRPDWILPPTDMQPDSHGKTGQVSTGVKLDDIVEEGGGEAVREGSLGSSSMEMEEVSSPPPARERRELTDDVKDIDCDRDGTQAMEERLFDASQETVNSLLVMGGVRGY
ncbi:hypothetical protein SLS55_007230 [Diplodia seriata]|uniref:Uncharacterized protein n=1 Tax=Diplodia seriata TaxID=420778 RepID=A0ABR3CBR3_9PEZI